MLYLLTGAPGSGKTASALHQVRQLQLKDDRPVYYTERLSIKPDKAAEFGWQKCNLSDWECLPDGSIILADECQHDLPLRQNRSPVPPHIANLTTHRHRGFDFFLLTQHPSLIDSYVRALIGSPGWHRHLVRVMGGSKFINEYEFNHANVQCNRPQNKSQTEHRKYKLPAEVFDWYDSATLHTAKVRISRKVWYALGALAFVGLMILRIWMFFDKGKDKDEASTASAPPVFQSLAGDGLRLPADKSNMLQVQFMSLDDWLAIHQPRIEGLPHTAPKYDQITQPVDAPYPAACVVTEDERLGKRCQCYTQQATKMSVDDSLCRQIAADGFFKDWASLQDRQGLAELGRDATDATPERRAQRANSLPEHFGTQDVPAGGSGRDFHWR